MLPIDVMLQVPFPRQSIIKGLSSLLSMSLLQALRFVKALICLGVHFYMVQFFPVDTLTSEWYYSLGIMKRYSCLTEPLLQLPIVIHAIRGLSPWMV